MEKMVVSDVHRGIETVMVVDPASDAAPFVSRFAIKGHEEMQDTREDVKDALTDEEGDLLLVRRRPSHQPGSLAACRHTLFTFVFQQRR